jgi:hypothetical protein
MPLASVIVYIRRCNSSDGMPQYSTPIRRVLAIAPPTLPSSASTEIGSLCPQLPDYELFRSLPGAGATLAPRLLVAFGERRNRYPSAAALQKHAGIAPVTERSGNKSWVHWRYACPKFLRQTFIESVGQTIPRSFWARAFYQSSRARGMRHQAALRALAFSGSACFTAAGLTAPLTMRPATFWLYRNGKLRSAAPPLRRRAPELVFIDGPSQGVSYAASGFYTSSSRFFSLFHQPELAALITLEIPKER